MSHPLEALWEAAGVDLVYRLVLREVVPLAPDTARPPGHLPLSALPSACCAAAGGDWQHAETVNIAWRLLYTALHILDSVQDEDVADEPWAQWGAGPAINITTGLIASTGSMLCTLEETGLLPATACAIRQDFFHTLLRMSSGQHNDLTLREPTLEQCWQVAEAKSGAWFALACRSGAHLATSDAARLESFGRYGHHLGVLVQIGDDVGGLWGQDGERSDLTNWPRSMLPVAYAMAVLSAAERDRLRDLLQTARTEPEAEVEARRIVITAGAILYLAAEARRHQQRAQHALLQAAPPSAMRDELLNVVHKRTLIAKP